MNSLESKAYRKFYRINARCSYPYHKSFVHYGAKGIKVEFSREEFIKWFVDVYKAKNLRNPDVGRIDHSKNYTIENIELIEKSENTKERNLRLGNPHPKKPVVCIDHKTNRIISRFESAIDGAKILGVCQSSIWKVCNGKRKMLHGMVFKYENEVNL